MQDRFFIMPDDGMDLFIRPLRDARRSIDIYVFTLSNAEILGALRNAAARGVAVRALVDPHPSGNKAAGKAALESLIHAGVQARKSPDYFQHSHAKSYVVDSALALISSINYLQDWQHTRDHGVIVTEGGVVKTLAAAFEDDWNENEARNGIAPPAPLVLSPNNSRATIMGLIASAKSSLVLEEEQITDPDIISALAGRSNAGVSVSVLTNAAQEKNHEPLASLKAQAPGVEVRYSTKLWVHSKLLIVDSTTMLMGSVNLTAESLDNRREVSIIITDPAAIARASDAVKRDLAASSVTLPDADARPSAPADSPSVQGHN